LLAHPEAHRPFAGGDLFARIGGRAAIDTLEDGLYDGIEVDAALRPFFFMAAPLPLRAHVLADLILRPARSRRYFTNSTGYGASPTEGAKGRAIGDRQTRGGGE